MCTFLEDLVCLLLRYAFDLLEVPSWRVSHRLNSVIAAIYNELDVTLGETAKTLHRENLLEKGSWKCALAMKTRLESCQRRGRTWAGHALIACLRLIVLLFCLGHFCDGVGGKFFKKENEELGDPSRKGRLQTQFWSGAQCVFAEVTLVAKL